MVKTRSAAGRFTSTSTETTSDGPTKLTTYEDSITTKGDWICRVVVILVCIILISPWLFLVGRNYSVTTWPNKMIEFYDQNFVCKLPTPTPCDCTPAAEIKQSGL